MASAPSGPEPPFLPPGADDSTPTVFHPPPAPTVGERPGTIAPELPPEVHAAFGDPAKRIGHYAIVGELGRGGMGVVYRAYDVSLRRHVAVKMILDPGRAGPEQIRRFEIEASAAARLRHPNIVSVFEVGSHEGKPYLVMELIEGESFEARLAHGKLPPREVASIVRGIALALQAAHDAGVVHRDVKPENVIVDTASVPHLMDFGLAREEGSSARLTVTGSVLGTPAYMAPEQADGNSAAHGPRTNVYGAGAVLYRALAGRPPFAADTIQGLLLAVLKKEPVALRSIDPSIPADLATIAQRCMAKEPERRYPTAGALALELGRFLDGEPIEARPVGQLTRSFLWARRNRTLASLLLTLVLVVLGAAGVVTALVVWNVESEEARKKNDALSDEQRRTEEKQAAQKRDRDRTASMELVHQGEAARGVKRDAGLAEFTQAIALDPANATAWFERGSLHMFRKDDDAAIADLTRAIDLDPRLVAAWNDRGSCRMRKNELDLALADFVRVIELDPRHPLAWRHRVEVLEKKGEGVAARELLDAELKKSRGSAYAWKNRAWLRERDKNHDGALSDLNEAIRLDARDVTSWFERGCVKESRNDTAGALADFTHAIVIDPHYEAARSRRNGLRRRAKDWDGLVADATADIELDPNHGAAYALRAEAKLQRNDLEGALADATKEIDVSPLKAAGLATRAGIKLKKNDVDGAIADTTRAVQLQPSYAPAYRLRAQARSKKGLRAEALEDYESYFKYAPAAPDAVRIRQEIELLKRTQR